MDLLPVAIAIGLLAYYWTHRDQINDAFWRWITEKSPYFLVSTDVSLTHRGMRKYINEALAKKVLELESKIAQLEEQLHEYEEKARAFKDAEKAKNEWVANKIQEILNKNIIMKPPKEVRVFTADYKFVGYLEYVAGTFDEAYAIVRTPRNERKIFGPTRLDELFANERTLGEQIDRGVVFIAYDSQGNKVSPAYIRVEV